MEKRPKFSRKDKAIIIVTCYLVQYKGALFAEGFNIKTDPKAHQIFFIGPGGWWLGLQIREDRECIWAAGSNSPLNRGFPEPQDYDHAVWYLLNTLSELRMLLKELG